MIKFLRSLEDMFFAFCKSIKWLNIGTDYLVQQAVIHALLVWALTVSLGHFNRWFIIIVAIYPLLKELFYDGHFKNWKTEGVEMHKDFYTDLITNYAGFIMGAAIILVSK